MMWWVVIGIILTGVVSALVGILFGLYVPSPRNVKTVLLSVFLVLLLAVVVARLSSQTAVPGDDVSNLSPDQPKVKPTDTPANPTVADRSRSPSPVVSETAADDATAETSTPVAGLPITLTSRATEPAVIVRVNSTYSYQVSDSDSTNMLLRIFLDDYPLIKEEVWFYVLEKNVAQDYYCTDRVLIGKTDINGEIRLDSLPAGSYGAFLEPTGIASEPYGVFFPRERSCPRKYGFTFTMQEGKTTIVDVSLSSG